MVRWFARIGDDIFWADSRQELHDKYGEDAGKYAKSFTFIMSSVEDNPMLMEKNPEYLSTLMSLPTVERERLRYGNWKVRASSGMYFKTAYFGEVDDWPRGYRTVRYWDRSAVTQKNVNKDPDWTAGCKMTKAPNGLYYIIDCARDRLTPLGVEELILRTAQLDGPEVEVILEQDPGQAGVAEVSYLIKRLAGFAIKAVPKTVRTEILVRPYSSQAQAGNVRMVKGPWNAAFTTEHVNFPQGQKDDQVVVGIGAFNELTLGPQAITEGNYALGGSVSAEEIGLKGNIFKPTMRRE
jgi:predicted phage terminase large subunit-like protein